MPVQLKSVLDALAIRRITADSLAITEERKERDLALLHMASERNGDREEAPAGSVAEDSNQVPQGTDVDPCDDGPKPRALDLMFGINAPAACALEWRGWEVCMVDILLTGEDLDDESMQESLLMQGPACSSVDVGDGV